MDNTNLQKIELKYPHPDNERLFNNVKLYQEDGDIWVEVFRRGEYLCEDVFGTRYKTKKVHFKLNLSKSNNYKNIAWSKYEKLANDIENVKDTLYIDQDPEGPRRKFCDTIVINDEEYKICFVSNSLKKEDCGIYKLGLDLDTLGEYFIFTNIDVETLEKLQDDEDCIILKDGFDDERPNKYAPINSYH